jgi:predicted component of type VI protein secretion system
MSRRFTIGRERNCDVPVADESVSRVHAEIWLNEDGSLMLADRGSSNGTVLIRAGQTFPLTNAVVMAADQVRLGNVTLPVAELIGAVESRNPGALTPQTMRPGPPPLPQYAAPPSAPPPPRAGGALIRCECGAIKTYGQICPGCHR